MAKSKPAVLENYQMKKNLLLAGILLFFLGFTGKEPTLDKKFAEEAFEYLNAVRQNPSSYSQEIGTFMKNIPQQKKLNWNDTLARIAETKAMDMAKNDYFNHVDPKGFGINYYINKAGYKIPKEWLEKKSDNYFESIGNNYQSGKEAISSLIIDEGVPSLGHRKHLLGIGDFYSKNYDIGIGQAVFPVQGNDDFKETYTCIIIARHSW